MTPRYSPSAPRPGCWGLGDLKGRVLNVIHIDGQVTVCQELSPWDLPVSEVVRFSGPRSGSRSHDFGMAAASVSPPVNQGVAHGPFQPSCSEFTAAGSAGRGRCGGGRGFLRRRLCTDAVAGCEGNRGPLACASPQTGGLLLPGAGPDLPTCFRT